MRTESLITNRFSPGNPLPIFFSGRQEELTGLLLSIMDWTQLRHAATEDKIHIVTGKPGIGKTSLLLRLKQQIQANNEMEKYIPLYLSLGEIAADPATLCSAFLREVESAITSLKQRDAVVQTFVKRRWQRVCAQIDPKLISIIENLGFSSKKIPSLTAFFSVLRDHFNRADMLPQLLYLWNWILLENGLFFVLLLDHFEDSQNSSPLLEILTPCLAELEKSHWHFFVVIAARDDYMAPIFSNAHAGRLKESNALFANHHLLKVTNASDYLQCAAHLNKLLVCGEHMPSVAVVTAENAGKAIETFQQKCSAGFFTVQIDSDTVSDFGVYLVETARLLTHHINKIVSECSQRGRANYFAAPSLNEPQFTKESSLERVVEEFCQFILAVDQYLQKNCPEVFIAIFWKNFEKLREATSNKMIGQTTAKNRLGDALLAQVKSCSLSFLIFFSAMSRCVAQISHLSVVPVWTLTDIETPVETRKISLTKVLHQKKVWPLRPLPKEDSIPLLQEIAARSAVNIGEEIAADIYQRTLGHPLLLHQFGHYLLAMVEQELTADEIIIIKNRLLKKYSEQEDGACNKLAGGPDGRTRIAIPVEVYQKVAATSPEDLYRRLLMAVHQQVPRKVVETIAAAQEELAPEMLLGLLKEAYPKLKQEGVNGFLEELKAIKLVTVEGNKIRVIHPFVKNLLREVLHLKEGGEGAVNANAADSQAETPTRSRITRPTIAVKETASESTAQEVQGGPLLLDEALSWLEHGKLPSSSLLSKLSTQITLETAAPGFKSSMRYIYTLCSQVMKRIEVSEDIGQAVSSIKDGLESWQKQQGRYDLRNVIEQKLLNAERIVNASNNNNHWTLANIHWLRCQFLDAPAELYKACEFLLPCLVEKLQEAKIQRLYWEIKGALEKNAENDGDAKKWCDLLTQAMRLLALQAIHNSDSLAIEIGCLLPSYVHSGFHRYLLGYLTSLLTREDSSCAVKQAALQAIGYYGKEIAGQPELVLPLLEECLHGDKELAIRNAAARCLLRLLPFLDENTRQEFRNMWEQTAAQDGAPSLRCLLLHNLHDFSWPQTQDEMVTYFHAILQSKAEGTIRAAAWEALASLKPLCEAEMQKEISAILVDAYRKMATQDRQPQTPRYSEILLVAIRKDAELIQHTFDFLVQGVAQEDNALLNHNSDEALSSLFPLLLPAHKEKTAAIYQQWLTSAAAEKRIGAITRLPLFYRFVADVPQCLQKITGGGDWYEREILLRNLWQWIGKMDSGSRALSLGKLLMWGETMLRSNCAGPDSSRLLVDMARLAPYCTGEQKNRLLQLVYANLTQGESPAVCQAALAVPHLLAFVDTAARQKLHGICHGLLAQQPSNPMLLSTLLPPLSMLADDEQACYDTDIVSWLRQQIRFQPEWLCEPGLQLLGRIWGKLPAALSDLIYQDVNWYLSQPEYAEAAVVFMAQCGQKLEELAPFVYHYQHYRSTMHLAFGLYELFPELADVKNLAENYELMMAKDPYAFGIKLAAFHFRANADERADQWLRWALEKVKSPLMKAKAMMLLANRQLFRLQAESAKQSLEKWHETFVGIGE